MEISPLQILILLFLLYPLIRRLLGGSGQQQEAEDEHDPTADTQDRHPEMPSPPEYDSPDRTGRDRYSESSTTPGTPSHQGSSDAESPRGQQTWEDFFEGLEKVISGEEADSESAGRGSKDAAGPTTSHSRQQQSYEAFGSSPDEAYRHPSHGPVYSPQESPGSKTYSTASSAAGSGSQKRRSARSGRDARVEKQPENPYTHGGYSGADTDDATKEEMMDMNNPIFADLDTPPMVTDSKQSRRLNVRRILGDPERVRDGIILKVILDPPKSQRGTYH